MDIAEPLLMGGGIGLAAIGSAVAFIAQSLKNVSFWNVLAVFLIILLIAMFFHQFKDNKVVAAMFRGIRPAVVALIAVPTFNLAKRAQLNRFTLWIPIVSALAIWLLGVSPIWIIILAGLGGLAWGKMKN